MQLDGVIDGALRSVSMDDIARSVVHLSNYIISNFSKSPRPDFQRACSTLETESGDSFEGTFGFFNYTKFLQNLCREESRTRNGQKPVPWMLARTGPLGAGGSIASKHGKLVSNNKSTLGQEAESVEENSTQATGGDDNAFRAEEVSLFGVSRSAYGSVREHRFESEVNSEVIFYVSPGDAASKEELGRATWTFLHTLAAQFPETPTKQQERDAKDLMGILSRIYPCKECADHFKEVLKSHPVETKSGEQLSQWMCRVHNIVNRSLDKPQFPCHRVDLRWGALDCNEGACDLHGRLHT